MLHYSVLYKKIYTNCSQRYGSILQSMNCSHCHLRDYPVAFGNLLLYLNDKIVEVTKPLRKTLVV